MDGYMCKVCKGIVSNPVDDSDDVELVNELSEILLHEIPPIVDLDSVGLVKAM